MEHGDTVKAWLIEILGGIVSHPEDIEVTYTEDDMGVLYVVRTHASDRGKVIGRQGAHANALRTLLRCVGMRYDIRASLKVDVPDRDFNLAPTDRAE